MYVTVCGKGEEIGMDADSVTQCPVISAWTLCELRGYLAVRLHIQDVV